MPPRRSRRRPRLRSSRPDVLALFGVAGAPAVLDRRRADPADGRHRLLDRARDRPTARRFEVAAFCMAARRVRASTLDLDRVLAGSAHEPDGVQADGAVPARAARVSASPTGSTRRTLVTVIVSLRGGQRRVRHRPDAASLHYDNLGQRPQGTLGHYMTLLGPADARHRRRRSPACCSAARSDVGGAGACRRSAVARRADVLAQRRVGVCAAVALLLALKDFRLLRAPADRSRRCSSSLAPAPIAESLRVDLQL